MRMGGRIAAAIEILGEIAGRHRPASEVLKDWGKAHRFAGSGDRHAIGTLVYDVLRKKNSLAHRMGGEAPRALALGAVAFLWQKPIHEIAAWCSEPYGPGVVSEQERRSLENPLQSGMPDWVAGDYPQWLAASFSRAFGTQAAGQGAALAERAPIDLRTNTLKTNQAQLLSELGKVGAEAGPLSPLCVRIAAPGPESRHINVEAEPSHGMGWFEVQDAASQVASLLTGVKPGEAVADICAGAGGKTLALAAMMQNQGRLIAHDNDRHRLRPIFERLQRAGASNVQVIAADQGEALDAMTSQFDCVLIDAPCSGSGSWRRKPDAKWRLKETQLSVRMCDQRAVLERGAKLVKPGSRLVYVTCSVLPEENGDQIAAFLASHPEFKIIPYTEQWRNAIGSDPPLSADGSRDMLLLTPASHDTDGFFVTVMARH
jgi:16S rRNA (cytosine967-C5)-methyltransferase